MSSRIAIGIVLLGCMGTACQPKAKYAVLVSANIEWTALKKIYPSENFQQSPWGEYFVKRIRQQNILFFHEGWGKVAAAGGTQYVIDKFNPEILINLGTCGGFEGLVQRYDVILANKTVIYDIEEAMGDSKEAIADYTTNIDLSWMDKNYPTKVVETSLVSADRDLRVEEIDSLMQHYQAVAGDWESGAIAYVAWRNHKKLLILRGVSDVVSSQRGEAYGNFDLYVSRTDTVMSRLLVDLPKWIDHLEK